MEDPDWLSDDQQRQWRTLAATVRLFNRALERQMLRDAGLPYAYYGILAALAEAPDRRSKMGVLASTLDFSPSRLSHAVARMEEAAWVERPPARRTHARGDADRLDAPCPERAFPGPG